jgi:transcriptional regulator with XRE-family HTH domain
MSKKYNLDLTAIGKRLRDIREALDITLEKMQEISGFSKSLISAAEKGQKKPSSIYLYVLLDRFHVDLNYVFSGKGNMFRHIPKLLDPGDPDLGHTCEELVYMIENIELVRYAMMTEYIKFKARNKTLINEALAGKEKKGLTTDYTD